MSQAVQGPSGPHADHAAGPCAGTRRVLAAEGAGPPAPHPRRHLPPDVTMEPPYDWPLHVGRANGFMAAKWDGTMPPMPAGREARGQGPQPGGHRPPTQSTNTRRATDRVMPFADEAIGCA